MSDTPQRHPAVEALRSYLLQSAVETRIAAQDYEAALSRDLDADAVIDLVGTQFQSAIDRLVKLLAVYRSTREIQGLG